MRNLTFLCAVISSFTLVDAIAVAEAPKKKPDTRPQLRKPVEPAEAAATFAVPKGFRVELVAAEPLVHDPMAMEFDENGIAYVLEIPAYNEYSKPEPHTPGSIARLEDTDGDGKFDRRTTFAGNLTYPTGLFCYDGGLFVGDAPNLWYLKDMDGDGKADRRDLLYTGFGVVQAGESRLNSFRWGLDNRIHISTGLDGGEIRPANQPDAPARSVRNRRILLEPRTRTFVLTSGGGQHGMSFDDWGRTYVCGNSTPVDVITYDDRYIERNPLMSAQAAVASLGPGVNFSKLVRASQPENWRLIRTDLLAEGVAVTDTYEWDRPTGVFTSATGITIYRGDALGDDFRGYAFIGEVVNNLVYQARLTTDGLTIKTEHVGGESGFLASTDTWFRPVQFAHGPDGNLYVVDMYRELIEGVQWVPPEVVAKMDPTAGSDRGRIYRIVREGFKRRETKALGPMATTDLVQLLACRNSWHRETAARLLYERQDLSAIDPLRRMLAESPDPLARMHAVHALDGLESLTDVDVLRGLSDSEPRVREHALRLAEKFAEHSAAVRQAMIGMTDDRDSEVRLQLAFSLGSIPIAERLLPLKTLTINDGDHPMFLLAIQSSLATGAAKFAASVLQDSDARAFSSCVDCLSKLADQIGRSDDEYEIGAVVKAIDDLPDEKTSDTLAKNMVVALLADGGGASTELLIRASQGRVRTILATLLADSRTTALDSTAADDARLEAIRILGCGSFDGEREAFDGLLMPQQPQPVQEAVVKTLGHFSDSAVAELLLSKWPSLTPGMRASTAEVLLSRPAWAQQLLTAVEHRKVSPGDFDPARIALLKQHPSQAVREKAAGVFANTAIVARRAEVVAEYQQALKLKGNVEHGRAAFQKACAACHVLEGQGTQVGAELTSIRDQGPAAIMLNVLDPNREINPKFLTYSATTTDGRVITGMITEETPNNLAIRQADGVIVPLPRTQIDEMESTGMSYMPEGLESQIDHQAMADLLAYLMSTGGKE